MAGRPRKDSQLTDEVVQDSSFVDDTTIQLRNALKKLGISYLDSENSVQLVEKLARETNRLTEKTISSQVSDIESKIRGYAPGTNLTDKDFIRKMYMAGVQQFYLMPIRDPNNLNKPPFFLFNDIDHNLTEKEIWARIRSCAYTPADLQQTLSKYSHKSRNPNKRA